MTDQILGLSDEDPLAASAALYLPSSAQPSPFTAVPYASAPPSSYSDEPYAAEPYAQAYPAQPYPAAQAYPGQQPYQRQPYPGQPYQEQPYQGQPYQGQQPYPADQYAADPPHPADPHPGGGQYAPAPPPFPAEPFVPGQPGQPAFPAEPFVPAQAGHPGHSSQPGHHPGAFPAEQHAPGRPGQVSVDPYAVAQPDPFPVDPYTAWAAQPAAAFAADAHSADVAAAPAAQYDSLSESGAYAALPEPPSAASLVTVPVRCHLNGEPVEVPEVWIADSLLFTLRERLGRTGTKDGCGEGECGACLVLLDGEPVLGCLTPALAADGAHLTTVEAYGEGDEVSAALAAHCGAGCGYCLPGIGLGIRALLARQAEPSEAAIRESLSGHLCRCLPPGHFIDAVHEVVERRG